MNNKKILIIINNFGIGGAERLVIDQANEINKSYKDIKLKIITLKKEPINSLSLQLKKEIEWECVDFKNIFDLVSFFILIYKILIFKPNLLFTHLWFSNFIGRITGKIAGVKKIICFEHNVYDTLKTRKMFLSDRILQSFCYKIIAVSVAVKDSLIRHGIRDKMVHVLLNGIDLEKYDGIKEIPPGLEQRKEFTFIFIGRLIYQKGVDILLKALSRVNLVRLIIVGSGAEEEKYKNLSKELGVSSRVNFLGNRTDIPELLCYADCFVLPSRYEGMPMVLLEAIASRKEIIVSNFGSASELIRNQSNGFIFNVDNIEELSFLMYNVSLGKIKSSISESDRFKVSIQNNVNSLLKISNL